MSESTVPTHNVWKQKIKKVALSKCVNIFALLVFGSGIFCNMVGIAEKYVLWVNVIFCLWAFSYLRAKSNKIDMDWWYVVLPLIYAFFDAVKPYLKHPGEVQDMAIGIALGIMGALVIIGITYGRELIKLTDKADYIFIGWVFITTMTAGIILYR